MAKDADQGAKRMNWLSRVARPKMKEAPLFCLLPICFTALGCVVLFFFADDVRALLAPLVGA